MDEPIGARPTRAQTSARTRFLLFAVVLGFGLGTLASEVLRRDPAACMAFGMAAGLLVAGTVRLVRARGRRDR